MVLSSLLLVADDPANMLGRSLIRTVESQLFSCCSRHIAHNDRQVLVHTTCHKQTQDSTWVVWQRLMTPEEGRRWFKPKPRQCRTQNCIECKNQL